MTPSTGPSTCPTCGGPAEAVHFVNQLGFYRGPEPRGFIRRLTSVFGRFARTATDKPLILQGPSLNLSGLPVMHEGVHCAKCRHVVLRYSE